MRTTPSKEYVKGSARKEVFGLPEERTPERVEKTSTEKRPKARAAAEHFPADRRAADMDTTEAQPEATYAEMKVPARQNGRPTKVYHAPRETDGDRGDDS